MADPPPLAAPAPAPGHVHPEGYVRSSKRRAHCQAIHLAGNPHQPPAVRRLLTAAPGIRQLQRAVQHNICTAVAGLLCVEQHWSAL